MAQADTHIVYLGDFSQHIPTVAKWLYQEFGYSLVGMSLEDWTDMLTQGQSDGSMTTFIVLHDHQAVATASLDLEDFPPRPQHSPWLASVYTRPQYRGKGLASRLLAQVEQEAKGRGFEQLFVHTADQEGFYKKRGWQTLEHLPFWGRLNTLMGKVL